MDGHHCTASRNLSKVSERWAAAQHRTQRVYRRSFAGPCQAEQHGVRTGMINNKASGRSTVGSV